MDVIPAIELSDVGVRGRLKSLRLGVHVGEVLGVIGPNGSGKSTLLSLMAGDLRPKSGAVRLFGRNIAEVPLPARAQQRAMLLQDSSPAFAFTVEELVGMAQMAGASHHELHYAVSSLELSEHWQTPLDRLSGGERQRAQIARVMAQVWSKPQALLLLDEPTNHLDLRHQQALAKMLKLRARRGLATVVATHDLNWIAPVADRVAVLARGELRACGKPRHVFTPSVLSDAFETPMRVDFGGGVFSISATARSSDESIELLPVVEALAEAEPAEAKPAAGEERAA